MLKAKSLIIGLSGTELLPEEQRLLRHPSVRGVLLLGHNFRKGLEGVKRLTQAIQAIRSASFSEEPFWISADFEAQRVWRAKDEQGVVWPEVCQPLQDMRSLGEQYEALDALTIPSFLNNIEDYAYNLGCFLMDMGINLNYAPVVDSHHDQSKIIGGLRRAFSDRYETLVDLSRVFLKGFKRAGLITCLKHFPDHGYAIEDSHQEGVVDWRSEACLYQHIAVYKTLIEEGWVDSIMTAHVLYPSVDPCAVASRSRVWHSILRNRLGFQGIIFSDCMSMRGAGEETLLEKVQDALSCGSDAVIIGTSEDFHRKRDIDSLSCGVANRLLAWPDLFLE